MPDAELVQPARALLEAYNMADWRRFSAIVTPDIICSETNSDRRAEGLDAYVRLCRTMRTAYPDLRGAIHGAFADDHTAMLEVAWESNTTTAPNATDWVGHPTSPSEGCLQTSVWFRFRNGKICAILARSVLPALILSARS